MFTPPPSPRPPKACVADDAFDPSMTKQSFETTPLPTHNNDSVFAASQDAKRRIGRRMRWAAILIPLLVVVVTLSTRYFAHPAALDVLLTDSSTGVGSWRALLAKGSDWSTHKRHLDPRQLSTPTPTSAGASLLVSASSSAPSASSSLSNPALSPVPTVPSAPPVLPTPFPQPFDSDVPQNFSTVACFNFFQNMTSSQAFRPCRPFSVLFQNSNQFIQAQQNLTLMNSIIWGTCNTPVDENQCVANMGWFASNLKTVCDQELSEQNSAVLGMSIALQAYSLMRTTACTQNPSLNTYCFIDAVRNANPSDLYFYSLPLGTGLPKSSTPSCSTCTKSIMGLYADALDDNARADQLPGLKKTYVAAAGLAAQQCGTGYVQTAVRNAADRREAVGSTVYATVLFGWTMLLLS